jgi:hypothetical protein
MRGARMKNALCKEHVCVKGNCHHVVQCETKTGGARGIHPHDLTGSDACANDMSAGAMNPVTKQQGFSTIEIFA